jgi:ribosome-associated translation inhibitor RaiA
LGSRLRRIKVYLQDLNSHKGGLDKRCSIEVHLTGLQPVAIHESAGTIDEAVSAAVDKMLRALERTVDRLGDRAGRVSMSGEGG